MGYPLRGSAGAHARWEPTSERRQTLGIRSSLGLFLVDERRRPCRHGVACVRHGGTSGCVKRSTPRRSGRGDLFALLKAGRRVGRLTGRRSSDPLTVQSACGVGGEALREREIDSRRG